MRPPAYGSGVGRAGKAVEGDDGMKCKFEHERDCFNCGSSQYMYKCKPEVCHSAGPTTNADRIRSMSDEQMAKELIEMIMELCEDGVPCYGFALEWLRRTA